MAEVTLDLRTLPRPEAYESLEVQLFERRIRGLSHSYGDAAVGTLVAIVGSSGRLEIAQVGGDAAERLGIGEGDPVVVRKASA